MSKVIQISAEVSYRKSLEETAEAYKFNEYPEDTQKLLRQIYRAGWIASKENTFQILETLTGDDNGKQQ